jgi:hypothetical protein
MNPTTSPNEIYQFRIVLRETSPHIGRLIQSDATLIAFHRVIQTAFGWSGGRSFSCHIQGSRAGTAGSVSNAAELIWYGVS